MKRNEVDKNNKSNRLYKAVIIIEKMKMIKTPISVLMNTLKSESKVLQTIDALELASRRECPIGSTPVLMFDIPGGRFQAINLLDNMNPKFTLDQENQIDETLKNIATRIHKEVWGIKTPIQEPELTKIVNILKEEY